MNNTYLLLGSNMGNSKQLLQQAATAIEQHVGELIKASGMYKTAAWGNTDQPDFLNQVLLIATQLNAEEILAKTLTIEKLMGRIRTIKNAPRAIDIDILFFKTEIIATSNLTIPHPEIPNRRFVLVPLNELSPAFVHPVLKKTIFQLLAECLDPLDVKKF